MFGRKKSTIVGTDLNLRFLRFSPGRFFAERFLGFREIVFAGLAGAIFLALATAFAAPAVSFAATDVSNTTLVATTTWSAVDSPFVIGDNSYVTISAGVTLNIEPGVVVQFGKGAYIDGFGSLSAVGTAVDRVTLTSLDSSLKGGDGTLGSNGWSIYLGAQYGGPTGVADNFRHLDIRNSSGIFLGGVTATIEDVDIEDSDYGFSFWNDLTTVDDLTASHAGRVAQVTLGSIDFRNVSTTNSGRTDDSFSLIRTDATLSDFLVTDTVGGNPAISFYGSNATGTRLTLDGGLSKGIILYSANGYGSVLNLSTSTIQNFSGTAIESYCSSLFLTGSKVKGNSAGVFNGYCTSIASPQRIIITGSDIEGNISGGATNYGFYPLDARGNYWGDPSGPRHYTKNPGGLGNSVSDGLYSYVLFDPWLAADPLLSPPAPNLEPVIIVPGIAGSELKNGDDLIWLNIGRMFTDIGDQFLTDNLALDSGGNSIVQTIKTGDVIEDVYLANVQVVNTFKGLADGLRSEGYIEESSLFFFPYDWRLNLDSARNLLKQKIDDVKTQTGAGKVNVIAHSMGGLLVKDYLKEFGKDSIDKLIFIGTPHLGAPKAGKILLAGDNLDIPWLDGDRIQEIAANSPAVYELLPEQTYFSTVGGYIKPYASLSNAEPYDYSHTKDYLLGQNLNSDIFGQAENFFAENLQDIDLSGIDAYNIAGCKINTQASYQLGVFNNIGFVDYSTGDGTVPLASSGYINVPTVKKYYIKKVKHTALPSIEDVKNAVVGILSGLPITTNTNFGNDSSLCGIKGKALVWRSPVDVHVYDSVGHHTGPIQNNAVEHGIPGVGYEIIGHEKFIYLPTDESENYRVEATGTDTGTFDLLIGTNDNGLLTSTQVFNDIPVTTSTRIEFPISDSTADNSIAVDFGTGTPETVEASATIAGSAGSDVVSPETMANVVGAAGAGGWYRSDVKVTLTATDDNAGVLETKYSTDGGLTFLPYSGPITVSKEGITDLKYFSVDKAGNNETTKSLQIKIDKTATEATVQFDTGTKSFTFQAESGSSSLCTKTKCIITDQAGNTTVLQFAQINILNSHTLTLQSIAYNGITQKFSSNGLVVILEENGGVIKKFIQTLLVKNQEILAIDYNPTKNESTVYSLKPDKTRSKQVLPGKKILQVITNTGSLQTVIK